MTTLTVTALEDVPRAPAHVKVTVVSDGHYRKQYPGFSREPVFEVKPGESTSTVVCRGTHFHLFKNAQVGDTVPTDHFAYYAAA